MFIADVTMSYFVLLGYWFIISIIGYFWVVNYSNQCLLRLISEIIRVAFHERFIQKNLLNTKANMEARNLGYSMKNIPIPPKQLSLKSIMKKVESFITRLKWKGYFFDKKEHSVKNTNFGFKSNFIPPEHELLSPFESDLYHMIPSINFKPARNDFQKKFTEDVNKIKSSENLLVFARKTTNLYEMIPEQYKTILSNNITKAYRKTKGRTQRNIDREAKTIFKPLQFEKRVKHYAERPAFISLKDHKENFKYNIKCVLINPSKGEMDVASKKFLEQINNKLNNHLCYNQWHSTSTELLEKFINFARSIIEIQDKITDIINHARKSLLFHDGNPWFKKVCNYRKLRWGRGLRACRTLFVRQTRTSG